MRAFLIEQGAKEYLIGEEEFASCYQIFGRIDRATQYDLTNPLDVTAQANGDYWDQ
jgi:hypothetical protein